MSSLSASILSTYVKTLYLMQLIDSFFKQSVYMLATRSFSLPLALSLVGNARVAVNAADTHNNVTKCLAMITKRLHRVLRVLCIRRQRYPQVACVTVQFVSRLCPNVQTRCSNQARQDAPMLPRVLHLKEVALLLYRSIVRGDPSWVRRPSGVRVRVVRSLVSLLSLLLSRHPHPFLSLAPSSVSGATGSLHIDFLPFH